MGAGNGDRAASAGCAGERVQGGEAAAAANRWKTITGAAPTHRPGRKSTRHARPNERREVGRLGGHTSLTAYSYTSRTHTDIHPRTRRPTYSCHAPPESLTCDGPNCHAAASAPEQADLSHGPKKRADTSRPAGARPGGDSTQPTDNTRTRVRANRNTVDRTDAGHSHGIPWGGCGRSQCGAHAAGAPLSAAGALRGVATAWVSFVTALTAAESVWVPLEAAVAVAPAEPAVGPPCQPGAATAADGDAPTAAAGGATVRQPRTRRPASRVPVPVSSLYRSRSAVVAGGGGGAAQCDCRGTTTVSRQAPEGTAVAIGGGGTGSQHLSLPAAATAAQLDMRRECGGGRADDTPPLPPRGGVRSSREYTVRLGGGRIHAS